jgi:hypothetical protein
LQEREYRNSPKKTANLHDESFNEILGKYGIPNKVNERDYRFGQDPLAYSPSKTGDSAMLARNGPFFVDEQIEKITSPSNANR